MEQISRLTEDVVVDPSTNTAYILRDLKNDPNYYVLLSHLRKSGITSFRFVSYEELGKLKESGEFSSFADATEESSSEEAVTSSEVLNEFAAVVSRAAKEKVSDIHIRTSGKKGEVFFRKNGMLVPVSVYKPHFVLAMMRAFYQNLSVSEANFVETEYQVAQFKREDLNLDIPPSVLSIRVQRGPQMNGQFMVLRLLYADTKRSDVQVTSEEDRMSLGVKMLTDYGYLSSQAREVVKVARQSAGIGIIAGPTGSGKSTALKTILEFQHTIYPWKAIYTIEDPPEYPIRGAVQLPVLGRDKGSKFAEALKVCMRSDPDIIMVGEVRDPDTAKLAVDASLTGHQVWTTVHAVHTFAVFPRLEGLGITADKLIETSVVKIIIAQRLLPKLCECKIPLLSEEGKKRVDVDIYSLLKGSADSIYVKNPRGCEMCNRTGVAGRVVVAEVLPVSLSVLEEINKKGAGAVYEEWRKENVDMVKHGLLRVLGGIVDPLDLIAGVGEFTSDDVRRAEQIWED